MSSFVLVCVTVFLMVCMQILQQQECRDTIYWDVYITIAWMLGLGTVQWQSQRKKLESIIFSFSHSSCTAGLATIIVYGLVYLVRWVLAMLRSVGWFILQHFWLATLCNNQCCSSIDVPCWWVLTLINVSNDPEWSSQPFTSQIMIHPCNAGVNAAVKSGADECSMSYNIMLAASASFILPFS